MSEHTILTLAGADIEVVDVDGLEQMSQLYRIAVRGRVLTGVVRPKDVAGANATLALFDGFRAMRTVNAIVERARTMYHDDGSVWLSAELRPAAWLLTLGRNCRSFQEKTVVEIVTEVLGGTPHRWETSFGYPVRAYTVQYRQDDWGFICRLLEQEGIHYWFDHDQGSILVLGDDSTDAPDLAGGARIEVHAKTGMRRSTEVIEELGAIAATVPTSFAVKSYSPKNPALDVSATSGAGALEFYDAPGGGPTLPTEAARSATIMHKAATAASATVRATTTSARLYPGRVVAPAGHPRLDGRYLVTRIRYEVRQRRRNEGEVDRPWICHFEALNAGTPFVAPRETPLGRQAGIQSGKVVGAAGEEIFPNEDGDVRVEQHWDRTGSGDDKGGTWMRVAQRGAHESMQLPRVGWNVLSFNDEGSVDAPSVLSRVNDGDHLPAYALPANKTRVVFKTQTSPADGTFNEIYFEDKKGQEEMYFCASRDMNILVQRVKNEGVGCDSTREIGNDRDLTVADDYEEAIDGDQTVNIGGDFIVDVTGACSLNVDGDLTENIGGDRTIDVGDAYEDAVKNDRTVTVGASVIEMSKGSIAGSGDHVKFEVGGPQLKMSQLSVADAHGGISMQKIAGARIEFTKEDRGLDVEKLLFETIGGALFIKTDKTYTDASEKTSKWTIAAALKSSTTELIVTAQDKIELVCGNSSVTLLPESVEIKADALDLSKSEVFEAEALLVENNC